MPAYRHAFLLPFLFAAAFASSAATTMWRCGNIYTDRPCDNGAPLAFDDRRDSGQQRDADAIARRAGSAAERMAQERLRLERSTAGRQAVLIGKPSEAALPKQVAASRSAKTKAPKAQGRKPRAASDHFTAQGPGTGDEKKAPKPAKAGKAKKKAASADKPRQPGEASDG